MDNGPHAADLIRFLFGDITSVAAQVSNVQKLDVEDTAKLDVNLANSAVGTSDLSWSLRIPARSYLEIYGEDGTATLDAEGVSYRFKTWSEWKRDLESAGRERRVRPADRLLRRRASTARILSPWATAKAWRRSGSSRRHTNRCGSTAGSTFRRLKG